MVPHVQLVSQTDVRLEGFLSVAEKAIGYTVTKPADNSTKPQPHERFLSALACFHDQGNVQLPLRKILNESRSLCDHLSYGFLFAADLDTILKSMERSGLKHTLATGLTGVQLAMVSGTLSQWTHAVVECCNSLSTFNLRLTYNKALFELEKLGIKFEFKRKTHNDQTILLEHKTI